MSLSLILVEKTPQLPKLHALVPLGSFGQFLAFSRPARPEGLGNFGQFSGLPKLHALLPQAFKKWFLCVFINADPTKLFLGNAFFPICPHRRGSMFPNRPIEQF